MQSRAGDSADVASALITVISWLVQTTPGSPSLVSRKPGGVWGIGGGHEEGRAGCGGSSDVTDCISESLERTLLQEQCFFMMRRSIAHQLISGHLIKRKVAAEPISLIRRQRTEGSGMGGKKGNIQWLHNPLVRGTTLY